MRVVGTCRVKNEIDIVEAMIRHNCRHLTELVFSDDGSTDGTFQRIGELASEGLAVSVRSEPVVGLAQGEYMTRLVNHAGRSLGADWVVLLDADEFIETSAGTRLPDVLAKVDRTPFHVHWSNFVFTPEAEASSDPNPTVRMRMRQKAPPLTPPKVVIPGSLVRNSDVVVKVGNHDIKIDGKPLPVVVPGHFLLAHFPVRSKSQYMSKIAIGHLQAVAASHILKGVSTHYVDAFVHLRDSPDRSTRLGEMLTPGPEAGVERPLDYLGEPIQGLRHDVDAFGNILTLAEQMAAHCAELKRTPTARIGRQARAARSHLLRARQLFCSRRSIQTKS